MPAFTSKSMPLLQNDFMAHLTLLLLPPYQSLFNHPDHIQATNNKYETIQHEQHLTFLKRICDDI